MATGTGKTLTAAAVVKLFLRSGNVSRVLFLAAVLAWLLPTCRIDMGVASVWSTSAR